VVTDSYILTLQDFAAGLLSLRAANGRYSGQPGSVCLPLHPGFYPGMYLTQDGTAGNIFEALRLRDPDRGAGTRPRAGSTCLPSGHGLPVVGYYVAISDELAAARQTLAEARTCADTRPMQETERRQRQILNTFAANRLAELSRQFPALCRWQAAPEPDLW
jgi:hypothetical protein